MALIELSEAGTALGGAIGSASAIKMIRSVMPKGIEALSAECVLTAEAAGVRGTALRQRAIGVLALAPSDGPNGTLAALLTDTTLEEAA